MAALKWLKATPAPVDEVRLATVACAPGLAHRGHGARFAQAAAAEEEKRAKLNLAIPIPKHGPTKMIEVILNDRLGKKIRVKCNSDDTIHDLKVLAAAHIGTRADKIQIKKW